MERILVKYFSEETERIKPIANGDLIDLRAAEDIDLKKFEYARIPLGIAMQLPRGFEALVFPRSSTFEKYGILQTNSVGVIDESYCGDDDQWHMPVIAMRDTHIPKGDRICQFRILFHQQPLEIIEVEHLGNPSRGGFGSSGRR